MDVFLVSERASHCIGHRGVAFGRASLSRDGSALIFYVYFLTSRMGVVISPPSIAGVANVGDSLGVDDTGEAADDLEAITTTTGAAVVFDLAFVSAAHRVTMYLWSSTKMRHDTDPVRTNTRNVG